MRFPSESQYTSLIDIGVNLTNTRFETDLDTVIKNAKQAGVSKLVVTGTSLKDSEQALALCQQYPDYLLCTSGVHPHDAKEWNDHALVAIHNLAQQEEVVAVGECGLDFFRNFSPKAVQLECFEAQLNLAEELNKPVFLHQRDAHEPFLHILKTHRPRLNNAVVHCFTGDTKEAYDYLDQDCYLGITGWLCDERRGQDLREAVKVIPKDRLMIETDAPYLLPRSIRPKPKSTRNEPAYLPYVLTALADIIDEPIEALAQTLAVNTHRFFGVEGNL